MLLFVATLQISLVSYLSFQVFAREQLCKHYLHQMSLHVRSHTNILPKDVSAEYPSYACLLGNVLEAAALALSEASCSFEMVLMLICSRSFFSFQHLFAYFFHGLHDRFLSCT